MGPLCVPCLVPFDQCACHAKHRLLSDYFNGKICTIREQFDTSNTSSQTVVVPHFSGQSFPVFQPVSEQTVKQFHRDISTKTCELDRLPVSLLYHCLDALPPGITRVINDCLVWGVFPNCFKRSSNRPPSPLKAIPWSYLFEKLQTCLKFSFPVKNH